VFGPEASGGEAWDQRTEKTGLEENKSISIAFYLFNSLASATKNIIGNHCSQKIFVLLCSKLKNPSRICGCKGSLLKFRKGKTREYGGLQVESISIESMLFFFRCF
jgi:hypothetical protein